MNKALTTILGSMLAASGIAMQAWHYGVAEMTGQGLSLAVKVMDVHVPFMAVVMLSLSMVVLGMAYAYAGRQRQPANPRP